MHETLTRHLNRKIFESRRSYDTIVSMKGVIIAIHGDVIEIEFSGGLPNINDSLVVKKTDGTNIILEVHDHISSTVIKAIALGFTQGLKRGMTVIPSGKLVGWRR